MTETPKAYSMYEGEGYFPHDPPRTESLDIHLSDSSASLKWAQEGEEAFSIQFDEAQCEIVFSPYQSMISVDNAPDLHDLRHSAGEITVTVKGKWTTAKVSQWQPV